MSGNHPPFFEHFAGLARDYEVLLCDVWGVIHNGVTAFPEACEALRRFRYDSGTVLLITNSPRPSDVVVLQLDGLNVPRDAYDAVVSSGDVTRAVMAERPGQSAFHLGPPRDLPVFEGLDVRLADADTADYVVCTGLFDDTEETPEDYREILLRLQARGLFMICANPDVVVERGNELVYCAGALADLYQSLGGEVLFAGKPHAPIYNRALAAAEKQRSHAIAMRHVLAIGDSLRTDLTGAARLGADFLFITAGIHAGEIAPEAHSGAEALTEFFGNEAVLPKAVMRRLVW